MLQAAKSLGQSSRCEQRLSLAQHRHAEKCRPPVPIFTLLQFSYVQRKTLKTIFFCLERYKIVIFKTIFT